MAKTDADKPGEKRKRAEKRIPKTVAGVRLPKDLRRAGDAILARAATPEGKALIAGGLSMAFASIAAASERHRKPAAPVSPTPDAPAAAGTPASPGLGGARDPADRDSGDKTLGDRDPLAIVNAIGDAVEATIARFLRRP